MVKFKHPAYSYKSEFKAGRETLCIDIDCILFAQQYIILSETIEMEFIYETTEKDHCDSSDGNITTTGYTGESNEITIPNETGDYPVVG